MGIKGEERMAEEKKEVTKVCPMMTTSTLMMGHSPLDNRMKTTQQLLPVGCLGEQCMLFNPKFKACVFIANAIMLTSIYAKEMGLVKEETQEEKKWN